MCRLQSVVSGSTLQISSCRFSQSVFLHVKWPAQSLYYLQEAGKKLENTLGGCIALQCVVDSCLKTPSICPRSACRTGEAKMTNGYNLAARYVSHVMLLPSRLLFPLCVL